MGEFLSVMWSTIRVLLLLLIGFAAIVYLGDTTGVIDARGRKCMFLDDVPTDKELRVMLEMWEEVQVDTRYMPDGAKTRIRDAFSVRYPFVQPYLAWIEQRGTGNDDTDRRNFIVAQTKRAQAMCE